MTDLERVDAREHPSLRRNAKDASYGAKAPKESHKQGVPAGGPVEVRHVVAALSEDRARRLVMDRFRARGGSLDRWHRGDLEVMAGALTHAEDQIEIEARGRSTPMRAALRAVRRRIEWTVWR